MHAAFAALSEGTVETLLRPENEARLARILSDHVVPGRVYAADALRAGTAAESDLTFAPADGTVAVNDATVTSADIEASNGVVHVIDAVLLPAERSDRYGMGGTPGKANCSSSCSATASAWN